MKNHLKMALVLAGSSSFSWSLESIAPSTERVSASLRPESAPYVAVYGGGSLAGERGEGDFQNTRTGDTGSFDLDLSDGWTGGVKGGIQLNGWQFDGFAIRPMLEVDGMYVSSKSDSDFNSNGATIRSDENWDVGAMLANALIKFENPYLSPYFGAGVGGAVLSTRQKFSSRNGTPAGLTEQEGMDLTLAAQGIFGLERQFTPQVALFLEYHYLWLNETSIDYAVSGGRSIRDRYENIDFHLMTAGIRYGF